MDIIELGTDLEIVAVQGSRQGYANDPYNLKNSRSTRYGRNAPAGPARTAARAARTRQLNQQAAARLNTTVRNLRENPGDRARLERNARQRARRAQARQEAAG